MFDRRVRAAPAEVMPESSLDAFIASDGIPSLAERWLGLRGPIALVGIGMGLILGLWWGWPGALYISGLSSLLLIEVFIRSRGKVTSLASAAFIDTTLIGITILVVRPPVSVVAMPYAYLLATTFLLLARRPSYWLVAYQIGWMSMLLVGHRLGWWVSTPGPRGLSSGILMGLLFILSLVGMFTLTGRTLRAVREGMDRRMRSERAITSFSRALLMAEDDSALDAALQALLAGTDASQVFVERNVEHPQHGLCLELVAEVVRTGVPRDPEGRWDLVPWSAMPAAYAELSEGRSFSFVVDELGDDERALYVGSSTRSELDIPILIDGKWVGLVGFNDRRPTRVWAEQDMRLLGTVAEMMAWYWAHAESRAALEEAVTTLDRRYGLEQALSRASQQLLSWNEGSIDKALDELLAATEADFVYLDENYLDPDLGLCARITHFSEKHIPSDVLPEDEWWSGAYSDLPTIREALSEGRPAIIYTSELDGIEREIHERDGMLSELNLPVFVDGVWRGSVAFTDYQIERRWTEEDVGLLSAAAEMFGAHWGREAARVQLEELLRSKDQLIASVSHELRTPLTAVLGFAEVLEDAVDDLSEAESRELLGLISREAREVAWIVEDLLAFARSDIGSLIVLPEDISLASEVSVVLAAQRSELATRVGVAGESLAFADPARVRQIIRNLLTNAFRYGGERVVVLVETSENQSVVRVIDDGDGIPEAEWEQIFEPYYRAHRQAGLPGSVGLGLAVARKLARLMGGDLRYRYAAGLSEFELTLPTARAAATRAGIGVSTSADQRGEGRQREHVHSDAST